MTVIDEQLTQYATPRQAEYIRAVIEHGSARKAAKAVGVSKSTVDEALARVKRVAARQGHAPGHFDSGTAPGYQMGKVTIQRAADGTVERTWERQSPEQDAMREFMQSAYEAMASDLPRAKPVKLTSRVLNSDLATVYTLTDSHVGAMCWSKENLDPLGDWDLEIAERVLTGCFEHMVSSSPDSRVAVVAQLGDFGHQDSISPVTPTSLHVLDSDSRFPKIVQTMVRILRRVIAMALAKHEKVLVLLAEGNHDISSSIWMRVMFKALYENEPRVEVIDSVMPYYVYQHGSTMLAWHHGHLKKNDQLPILFAAQFPKVWGATVKRYAHCGHRHHVEEKSTRG